MDECCACSFTRPRAEATFSAASPHPLCCNPQENVALLMVYSALMVLAWRDTVPDTVPFMPFARLLCDVMLTTLQEPTRKCIKIPTSKFTTQFRVWLWSCTCKAESAALLLLPRSASSSVVLAPLRRPAAAATIVASSQGSESHVPRQCSIQRIRLASYQNVINHLQACYSVAIALQHWNIAGIETAYSCHCTPQ